MNIPNTKIAVTLFNLRQHCTTKTDLDKTLAKVKAIGYEAVQVSGVPLAPEDVKELLDKHGLYVCATHEKFPDVEDDFDNILKKLRLWNCDFAAVGSPGPACSIAKVSPADADTFIGRLEEIGIKFKNNGVKFGYHNHHQEFTKIGDRIFLEKLYDQTSPDHLYAEIDVHWVTRGGGDPVWWIRKVNGRMPVVHLKDFTVIDGEPRFCEIGYGNLNWPAIIQACEETNVRWYSIEQDKEMPGRDIFTSIEMSYNNLKKMGIN